MKQQNLELYYADSKFGQSIHKTECIQSVTTDKQIFGEVPYLHF